MDYQSPIQIMQKQIAYEMDENVLKAVQSYGITVNPQELKKALLYDRQQYQKGYEDGCKPLSISIYDHYNIKHTYIYSYSDFDYDDLLTKSESEDFKMDGGEFLQKIVATAIQDKEFSSIAFGRNMVAITFFDPTTGHSSDHLYELQEVIGE